MIDTIQWVFTCPQFIVNHFLICKHLVQAVHPIPPVFFHQVKQNHTLPFWTHPSLLPLSYNHIEVTEQAASASVPSNTSESLDKQLALPEHDLMGPMGLMMSYQS